LASTAATPVMSILLSRGGLWARAAVFRPNLGITCVSCEFLRRACGLRDGSDKQRDQDSPAMGFAKQAFLLALSQDLLKHMARLSVAFVLDDLSAAGTADATFAIIVSELWVLGDLVGAFATAEGEAEYVEHCNRSGVVLTEIGGVFKQE
jgi:hypothetical protein